MPPENWDCSAREKHRFSVDEYPLVLYNGDIKAKECCAMVRHIVSWNFKPELSEEQRREIGAKAVAAIDGLKGQIPCLVDIKAQIGRAHV